MALVLALLLTTLCGVHAAYIPSSSLDTMLASKLDKLEKRDTPNLDKVRRSVLEDMKRLLDNQLATLFENAVTRKAGAQRKRLKSNAKSHATSKKADTPDLESIISEEEPQNSELIKVLTDDSLQDPGEELLRNAVDQLLKEDEDGTADNLNNSEIYNNEDQPIEDNSTKNNSEEFLGEDAFDDATLLNNTNDKHRQKGKSNKKGKSHVIIQHVPKSIKNEDDGKNTEDIIDLDNILKAALKDFSGSLSQEDEDSGDGDLEKNNPYPKTSDEKEPGFSNNSQTVLTIHDSEDNSFQVDGINNVDIDENTLKPDETGNNLQNDDDDNGELKINPNHTNNVHFKTNHHKHIHQHGKNHISHQPINHDVISDKNRTHKKEDINSAGKYFNNIDINDTKDIKLEEKEDKKDHNKRQHPHKKSRKRYGKKHSNKNHHSKNQVKHKHHNDNKTHDNGAKGHHIIVRLINDSDGSNESKLNTMHDTITHKNPIHSDSSDLRNGHYDSKQSIYNRDNYDLSELRENTINEANASQDDAEDKNNLPEINDLNSNEEENNVTEYNSTNEDEEDYLIERENVTKEESSKIDDEQVTREGNKETIETGKGKKENNADYEDEILIESEGSVEDNENNAEKVLSHNNKSSKEIDSTEAKTSIRDVKENYSEDENVVAEKDKKPKKVTHKCHDEEIGNENDEANIIHDLLHNKDMKKSYSLSLTLSTK